MEMLLDPGADVNVQGGRPDDAHQTPLYRGHEAVVKILLDVKALMNKA